MKTFFRKYKHLTSLLAVSAAALLLLHFPMALAFIACWQLLQIAMSKPKRGYCYEVVGLTKEQIKEFEDICKDLAPLKDYIPGLKGLGETEGGIYALKGLPALLGSERKRMDEIQGQVKKLRKQLAKMNPTGTVRWVGNVPFVTDECAKALTSVFIMETAKLGEKAMSLLNPNQRSHEGLLSRACENLGADPQSFYSKNADGEIVFQKAAMTATELPLPTQFIPQVIELVFRYGQARQYATVYPLGAGPNKLPRLQAGEDDFGYLGAGTASMSVAVGEKKVAAELVTFNANKAGGLIRIPTELEEDTFIPMGQFLARYIARQLAKLEDKTLFLGDGTATYASQVGVGKYCANNTDYLLQLDAAKTKVSDITLDDLRNLRGKVSAAVLGNMGANGQTNAAYYFHPTMEPLLRSFNKYPNFVIFTNENGKPMFDGWPVRWIGVGATNNGQAQPNAYATFFGDLSYWYLGERGSVRVEVSKEVFFASDELAMRALERIDVEALAVDAMVTLQLGAGA